MSQRRDPPNRVPPLQTLQVNPVHVLGQLARALTTSQTHESPEVRERAVLAMASAGGVMALTLLAARWRRA